jgi:hypothetical protein
LAKSRVLIREAARGGKRLGSVAVASTATTTLSAATTITTTAATASTTASTTAVSTPATTTAAETAATTTGSFFLRTGFIDGQGATVVLDTVEGGNRGCRLVVAGHFDKTKTLAATGIAVVDDLRGDHLAMSAKQLLEFRTVHVVTEIPHVQLLTHVILLYGYLQGL